MPIEPHHSKKQQNEEALKPNIEVQEKKMGMMQKLLNFFGYTFDLREGLDRSGTVKRIQSNIEMRGANVWLLICAIFIASIGLDNNSPAVIIGAMLISPLMSPILGVGLAIGINDRKLLGISLFNFLISVLLSLAASVTYFYLSPLGSFTHEMESRISPTLLDVLIAFFGGVAGIVAGSRKELINAIPGVAIATALLPPLCVSGYGLAHGDLNIFWGSFYLFFLNSVFVALATYIIVRLLRFPFRKYMDVKSRRISVALLALFVGVIVIPSGLKLYEIIGSISREQLCESFIYQQFTEEERLKINWQVVNTDSTDIFMIRNFGEEWNQNAIKELETSYFQLGVVEMELEVVQANLSNDWRQLIEGQTSSSQSRYVALENKLLQLEAINRKYLEVIQGIGIWDAVKLDDSSLEKELQAIYPQLNGIELKAGTVDSLRIDTLQLSWGDTMGVKILNDYEQKLSSFIQQRYSLDTIQIISVIE